MKSVIAWIQSVAAAIGGPGLFIIAFLDSSFLSLPQINDLLVITMVVQHPTRMLYYATMATLGSVAGCSTLYLIARKGGDAFIRKRISGPRMTRATETIRKYGVLAIIVPALLPPPAPFKLFVLLAGVAGVRPWPFVLAVAVGRGVRYFAIGLLTLWYGRQAIEFLDTHGREVALWLGIAALVGGLLYILWRQTRRRRDQALTSAG
jgi:membrane protein YqaA with SNARE-associated domain